MNNEKFPRIIREAEFYIENSSLDEANSCVRVSVNSGTEFGPDDFVLLARKVEQKFPNLKFTGKYDSLNSGEVVFFFK